MLAPSDFSALKNFVWQPVYESRSKFCFIDSKFVIRSVFSLQMRNFFYLNPPVSNQNNRVWAGGKKADVKPVLSLSVRSLCSMWWSRLACFGGKGPLHFVDESTKVDSAYDVGRLLPSLVDDCTRLLPSGYIFEQDGTPTHTARATQNWLQTNCSDFIAKDQWPPNSPDLMPLDYHVWGAMLEAYHKRHPKPKTIAELKEVLQVIWDSIPYYRDQ